MVPTACNTRPPGRLTLPRVLLTDSAFVYTCAAATNVAETISRERRLLAQEQAQQQQSPAGRAGPSL